MKLTVISWGTLSVCQAKSLDPAGDWHSLHAGCETLRLGCSKAMPCCTHARTVHGKLLRESQELSPAYTSPQICLPQHRGFSPWAVATLPCELGSSACSYSAPFNLGSVPTLGHCRMSQGRAEPTARVGHAPEPGWAMPRTPARGSGRPAVSRGVRGLSLGARRSPGDSLCRAAPDGSWSQGRLQTMGGEQETPHGKQDLAPPPPATAPWPLSFPCSREPFPQPSATGLHRGDGDAAARTGWGMRHSEPWTKSRVRTPPAWARGSAWLREP